MREGREGRESRWRRLKAFVALVAVAFAVTLAVIVGNRLSEEALGVLAGAVCGVGAAIPTSLIVVAMSRRQGEGRSSGQARMREADDEPRRAYPPVIVVSPQDGRPQFGGWDGFVRERSGYRPTSMRQWDEREFTVVGGATPGSCGR
jgi:hypothetical protein